MLYYIHSKKKETLPNKGVYKMKKFEIGKKYYSRSICDYNCLFIIEIIKRTEKTITFKDSLGKVRRSKIQNYYNDCESLYPDTYSFAPIYKANREYN